MSVLQRYLLPDSADLGETGRLRVGGCDLLDLAAAHGTPLFVYDEDHLRARAREAVSAWGDGVAYATKAFLCKAMAALAAGEGMCLDVSTGGELEVALAAGVPPERLVLHGNNKLPRELERAVRLGLRRIVVDSFDELDRLEAIVGRNPRTPPPVLLRVTPGVEAHTHAYTSTGQEDSKFGFGLHSGAAAEAVARCRRSASVELVGLHAHIGSQVFRVDAYARAVEALAELFVPLDLPELCVGGGLGVPYVAGERAPGIAEWAGAVRRA
ncbi:MAG: diaminopimelate decarboxylase family protein, partial [Acidimicrobiales bacterium]